MQIDPSMTYTREQVVANLRKAANSGPVSFDFLLKQAEIESGLNPYAKASTSSAAGPFQFVNGTWLRMVEKHGDSVGLSEQAAALRENRLDDAARSNLLALRSDIQISTKMAAHFAVDNAKVLVAAGHRQIGPTELYLAHFLGAGGAAEFLSGMRGNPNGSAAEVLPEAARANKSVFFANGAPRSFTEIYHRFSQKFSGLSAPLADGAEVTLGSKGPVHPAAIAGGDGSNLDPALMADQNFRKFDPSEPDLDAIAQDVLAEARAAQRTSQRTIVENSDLASATQGDLDRISELSEAALASYLGSFSKSFADPAKATLGSSEAMSRDASRGAEVLRDVAEAATGVAPPTVALGMQVLLDATAPSTQDQSDALIGRPTPGPAMAPSVRQAVQWVSLFSDPRGSDAAYLGRP